VYTGGTVNGKSVATVSGVISGKNNPSWGWENCRMYYTPTKSVHKDFGRNLIKGAA